MFSTYLVAISSAAFAAISALTWIYAVRHMDPAATDENPAGTQDKAAA